VRAKKRIRNRNNKQKRYYSGKKKRHTLKSQVVVDKKSKVIICTSFSNGKKHDFKLFKDSGVRWTRSTQGIVDSGYTGIKKLQSTCLLPKKRSKNKFLTKAERQMNRDISSKRVLNENVIGRLKRFKILSDRYRNRCKRFGLRFNLIAGIQNWELRHGA
jgi:DDE superfamily endonuclease